MFRRVFVVLFVTGLLLTACGGQGARNVVEVQITLSEFGIESSLTEFETGVPYRFVVTNAGAVEHEFMIMPPLVGDQMGMDMNMMELDEMALAMIPADKLPSGSSSAFEYTFMETAPVGTLEFACHTPGYYEANMKLPITIQ